MSLSNARIAAQCSIMLSLFNFVGPVPSYGGLYTALCQIEAGEDTMTASVPRLLMDAITKFTEAEDERTRIANEI